MTAAQAGARVAIVGAGDMGAQHAEAYQAIGAEVVAVCDVDAERASSLAASLGARGYTDVDTMLDEMQPAEISICTPPAQHLEPALSAIRHGIPLLIEKPLAHTLDAAQTIAEAAAQQQVVCMVGFCHRFHEPILQLKERLDAGEIGSPVLFRNRFAYRFEGVERSWFSDPAVAGGGTLMDTSVHSVDLYRFLIGDIDRVAAQLSTETPGLTVEDNSVLLVNGPAGVPGIIEASWTTPAGESELIVFGTKGNLGVNYERGEFGVAFVEMPETGRVEVARSDADRFAAELAHFLRVVEGGGLLSPNVDDGLRALEVLQRAYRAAAQTG